MVRAAEHRLNRFPVLDFPREKRVNRSGSRVRITNAIVAAWASERLSARRDAKTRPRRWMDWAIRRRLRFEETKSASNHALTEPKSSPGVDSAGRFLK